MTTEAKDGLTKRTPVRSVTSALIANDSTMGERAVAGTKIAVVGGGVGALGFWGLEEVLTHAGGVLPAVWNADAPGLVAAGAAGVAAGVISLQARYDMISGAERHRYYSTDVERAEHVGIPRRNFFRRVSAITFTGAGAAGVFAAGLDHASLLGLHNATSAAAGFGGTAEALASVGVVAAVSALGWGHRAKRQAGPAARAPLGE